MAIWQKVNALATDPVSRVQVDTAGWSWARFLSPSFVLNDGVDYGNIGRGTQFIFGGCSNTTPTYYAIGF